MRPESEEFLFDKTDTIDLAFEPLYALERAEYNVVVNSFFNLTMTTVRMFQEMGETEAAQAVAERARTILQDYDDDLADLIMREAVPEQEGAHDEVPWE